MRYPGLKNMPHPEVVDIQNVRHFKDIITYLNSEFKIDVH